VAVIEQHDRLDDLVQPSQAQCQRHLDSPPYGRIDAVEFDANAGDPIDGVHTAMVALCCAAAQFHGKSSTMRLIEWSAIRVSTSRR
jgi:hypothetical protein